MCKVKTGTQITEMHDIQNLVTARILRSKTPYQIRTLSKEIMDSCIGSKLVITNNQIEELVQDTTMALLRAKYISSDAGYYYVRPLR